MQRFAKVRRSAFRPAIAILFLAGLSLTVSAATHEAAPGAGSAVYGFGGPGDGKSFAAWLASPCAGLIFVEGEPVDVRVRVGGANEAASIEYSIQEVEGPWKSGGAMTLPKGITEGPLPLKLPGRGLFRLSLSAKSGKAASKVESPVAVVFAPGKPDPASPWGIFFTPHIWYDKDYPHAPQALAQSHRLLGASWSRLNFWAHSFGKVTVAAGEEPKVTADYHGGLWKEYARALRAEGISIMGEISQCPTELSSRPGDTSVSGDAGELRNRVKPANWALWERFIRNLAADFREEIQVWEIWNEPDIKDRYWTGTAEDFAELVIRTSQAFRAGNPNARVAAAGFTPSGSDFAEKLFQAGIGKHIDILSFHYTDESPGQIRQWADLAGKHGVKPALWNTEEKSEVPIGNIAHGVERSFKFIHVNIGYPDFRPLVNKDLTARPSAVWFSVGAHCVGNAKGAGWKGDVPGVRDVYFFKRGDEKIAALRAASGGHIKLFGGAGRKLALKAEPLPAGKPVTVTDRWGRSLDVALRDGRADVGLGTGFDPAALFVNGAREVEIESLAAAETRKDVFVFEAEQGRFSKGWSKSSHEGFSEGTTVDVYLPGPPDADGLWADLTVKVPADGRYEVLFAGNALSRLKPPRSLSPFSWRIDDGPERRAEDGLPVIQDVAGAPEGVSVLGEVDLKKGEHRFRLKLLGPRDEPDKYYAIWFDALALRQTKK